MARVARRQQNEFRPRLGQSGGPRDHNPRQRRNDHSSYFAPGAIIPESGIYEIIHDDEHRAAHESVLVKGDVFPSCDICQEGVRFRVVRTAPYIFEDEDFVD